MTDRTLRYDTTLEVGPLGLEVDVEITFAFYPGTPGRTYGPPENCHPAEPDDAEWISVRRLDGLRMHSGVNDAAEAWWSADGRERCIAHALES
jgi:hypothetical protein